MSRHYTTLRQSTDPGPRRTTYTHKVADAVPLPAPMPVTEVEMSGLRRGIIWALAISCPLWAVAFAATLVWAVAR